MLKELQAIFENVDKEILNEDTLKAISTLVEQTVDQKVNDRVVLETENKLRDMDEDHSAKMVDTLKRIDEDHTAKAKLVVESINKDHVKKLNFIKTKYDTVLKETATEHRNQLVESINDYLDSYLDKVVPKEQLLEAAKNKHLAKLVEEAREVLGVDEKFIKSNIKSAIKDGKAQLDTLVKENAELKKAKLIEESKRFLVEKTSNMPAEMAKFVRARLVNKSPDFIKENFQYVVDMFDRREKSEKHSAINENSNKNNFVDRKRVADEIIKENKTHTITEGESTENPEMSLYLEGMGFRK